MAKTAQDFPITRYTDANGVRWVIASVKSETAWRPSLIAVVDPEGDIDYPATPELIEQEWSPEGDDDKRIMEIMREAIDKAAAKAKDAKGVRRKMTATAHPDDPGMGWLLLLALLWASSRK